MAGDNAAPQPKDDTESSGSDIEVHFGGDVYHFQKNGEAYVPTKVTNKAGKAVTPSPDAAAKAFSELPKIQAAGAGIPGFLEGIAQSDIGAAKDTAGEIKGAGETLANTFVPGQIARSSAGAADKENTEHTDEEDAASKKLKKDTKTAAAPESSYEELANQLAQTYLSQIQEIAPYATGENLPGLTSQAVQTATQEQTAPGTPTVTGPGGESIGNWNTQQMDEAAQASQAAGVPAAMASQGNALVASAPSFAQGVQNTGPANAAYLEAAPYSQLLQELASETAYKAASGEGAAAFGATKAATPAWLQQIYGNLGLGTYANPTTGSPLQAPTSLPTTSPSPSAASGNPVNPNT